jgi:hypothetical protein
MNRQRLIIAGATVLAIIGLLGWQYQRERQVRACLETGGIWHGPDSACRMRPILQRDYQRS